MEPLPQSASTHAAHNTVDGAAGTTTTLRDAILLHPNVHVGAVSKRTRTLWVHEEGGVMAQREVTYVPALLKVFDEVLLHAAADTKRPRLRDPAANAMDTLRVHLDAARGRALLYSTGAGMDVLRVDVDAARSSVSVYCSGAGGVPMGVSLTFDGEEGFEQVSFVNNVATLSGGTHVDHVANKIAAHVVGFMKDKFEQYCVTLEEDDVKRHLMLFVHVVMENPTFDSPAREALITPREQFGSECELSDLFYRKVRGSRLLARLLATRSSRLLDGRSISNKRRRQTVQR